MKFARGTAQELINWLKTEGYKFPVIAIVDNLNKPDVIEVLRDHGAMNVVQRLAFKASHPMFIKYLGIDEHETNIGIYIRKLLKSL